MDPADDIADLYDRRVEDWDADRDRSLFEAPWLVRFSALLPAGGRVLDIGCGSGEPIGRYFIEGGFSLTGVDASPKMIALCRDRFSDHDWRVADMRQLDLGAVFDGILLWHSLFHLPPQDQPAVFAALRRHARSGTALMFTSGTEHGDLMGQWRGEALYHGSLSTVEYHDLLAQNGFEVIDHVENDATCGGANIWLARLVS